MLFHRVMSTSQKNTPKTPSTRTGAKAPAARQPAQQARAPQPRQEPVQGPVQEGETSTSNVGLMLKKTRLKYNLTLQDVSNYLNIRRFQIESIEEGRFHELPATAYAVGFIKSYSSYLGLDPDLMVDRFKQETGKQVQKIDLDIPAPLHEGRLPDQKIVITSIIATLAFIALMFFVFRDGSENQEVITEVPNVEDVFNQDVANQMNATTGTVTPLPAQATGTTEAPASPEGTTPVTTTEGQIVAGQATAPVDAAQPVTAQADGSAIPADGTAPTLPATTETTTTQPGVTPQVVVVDGAQPATPTTANPAAPTEGATPADTQTPADNTLLDAENRATVYGSGNVNSRISIKAKQNSWIEIKDSKNNILLSRVLKPDDVYNVPADLKTYLTTGNAGGLDVYINNKFAGVAGKPGEVLRNYQITSEGLISP